MHGDDPVYCLVFTAMFAPFAVIFGPIAHDEVDPPSPVPQVLLTAFLLAILATVLSGVIRSLGPKKR